MKRLIALVGPSLLCLGLATALYVFSTRQERLLPAPPATMPSELAASLVRSGDVGRYPAGSPERAFLSWWRSAQYDDVGAAYAGLSDALRARVTAERFAGQLQDAAGGLSGYLPRVAGQTSAGRRITLQVAIIGFARGRPSAIVPRTFEMRRERGAWRLDDLSYVETKAGEGRRAAAAARAAARAAGP
jgi:hypothetical protein